MKKLLTLTLCVLLFSCSEKYTPEIEDVLKQAGENRSQLEKVLKHYAQNSADSLKLRAAEFLIENMPGKYSVEYDMPFENLMTICMRLNEIDDYRSVEKAYGSMSPVTKEDVKYITGDYLINNIELAFKVWEEQPWGKDIPFDVFCEEILPYRFETEPLENWREKVLAIYTKLNSSFKTQPGITVVEACAQVNSQLPTFRLSTNIPDMNYSMLMTARTGMCDEMVMLAVFAMRALGIPVSKDYILTWPGRQVGHSWNSGYAGAGKRFYFMGIEHNPEEIPIFSYLARSKIYRRTYVQQNNINADNADIPPALHDRYMKDVTHEYFVTAEHLRHRGFCELEIPVKSRPSKNTGYAYLAVTGEKGWNITGWGASNTETVNFGMTGKNILYLPVYFANGVQTPVNYPFWLDSDNSIQIFEPDTGNYQQLTVTEILPTGFNFMERMRNGFFEGANRSDFSDARVLHRIKKLDGTYLYSAKVGSPASYRYVRYVSPVNGHGNVAEIEFYNSKGEKLEGAPLGSPVPANSQDVSCDKAFDGDISTFYDTAPPDGAWTGLDFGAPQTVAEIKYFPRHDGNFIYKGDTYELFCCANDWQLYERQVAPSHILNFRVPANGLYYLKNVTTNQTGAWFTVDANGNRLPVAGHN